MSWDLNKGSIPYIIIIIITPEIETVDLSQSDACLNLFQFQADCLLRIKSSTAILNYLNQYLV